MENIKLKVYRDFKPGEPAGYSPQLDRELLSVKVYGLLQDFTTADFIHVSNSEEADALCAEVVGMCKFMRRFDQYSIIAYIMEIVTPLHAEHWQKIGQDIMDGKDSRARCKCGKLATRFCGDLKQCAECGKGMMADLIV